MKNVFKKKEVAVVTLTKHPFLDLAKSNGNSFYYGLAKEFGHYEQPVIDQSNRVLSHWEDVEAAKFNNVSAIDVLLCELNDEDKIDRLTIKGLMFHEIDILQRPAVLEKITDHWRNTPSGQIWFEEIKALIKREDPTASVDMNLVAARLLGCSKSTIKNYKRIKGEVGGSEQQPKTLKGMTKTANEKKVGRKANMKTPTKTQMKTFLSSDLEKDNITQVQIEEELAQPSLPFTNPSQNVSSEQNSQETPNGNQHPNCLYECNSLFPQNLSIIIVMPEASEPIQMMFTHDTETHRVYHSKRAGKIGAMQLSIEKVIAPREENKL